MPNSTAIKATTLHLPHLPTPRFSPFPADLGQARAYSQAFSQPRKLIPIPPVPPGTRQQLFIAIPKPGSNPLCLSPRGKPRFWLGGVGLPPAAGHRSVLSLLTRNIQSGWAAFAIPAIRIDDVQPSPCCGHICFFRMLVHPVPWGKPHSAAPCLCQEHPMGLPRCKWDSNHTGQDTLCTLWGYRAKVFLPGGRGKSFGAEHPMGDTQRCAVQKGLVLPRQARTSVKPFRHRF